MTTTQADQQTFRDVLGHYASGVTVVTSIEGGEPVGFTCRSFYPVSVEPPLVSFSAMKTSTNYPRARAASRFAVNVLAEAQSPVASQFARKGAEKWRGTDWSPSRSGTPIIATALMWVDCDIWAEHDAGDHMIVVGLVREMSSPMLPDSDALLYFRASTAA